MGPRHIFPIHDARRQFSRFAADASSARARARRERGKCRGCRAVKNHCHSYWPSRREAIGGGHRCRGDCLRQAQSAGCRGNRRLHWRRFIKRRAAKSTTRTLSMSVSMVAWSNSTQASRTTFEKRCETSRALDLRERGRSRLALRRTAQAWVHR
ncbi:hypothetical protein MRB53_038403 [Persea americana]|nr:hypothetical protein MRB53_038403 [Persea americana]